VQAITAVADILLNYGPCCASATSVPPAASKLADDPAADSDKRVPLYGFGAKLPDGRVSHCFPLNGNPSNVRPMSSPRYARQSYG
jgi:hypothetical protein